MSRHETFCIVNIEAMAVGIPIVSHGTYGQGEYFVNYDYTQTAASDRGNSVIVPQPTVESLASAVLMLADNETMRVEIGRNAQRLVNERFQSYQAASRYMSAMVYAHDHNHKERLTHDQLG